MLHASHLQIPPPPPPAPNATISYGVVPKLTTSQFMTNFNYNAQTKHGMHKEK